VLVAESRVGNLGTIPGADFQRKASLDQKDKLPPRFTGEAVEDLFTSFSEFAAECRDAIDEFGSGLLEVT
jgi:hypothetical protein